MTIHISWLCDWTPSLFRVKVSYQRLNWWRVSKLFVKQIKENDDIAAETAHEILMTGLAASVNAYNTTSLSWFKRRLRQSRTIVKLIGMWNVRGSVTLSTSIATVRRTLNFYSIVKPDRLRSETSNAIRYFARHFPYYSRRLYTLYCKANYESAPTPSCTHNAVCTCARVALLK